MNSSFTNTAAQLYMRFVTIPFLVLLHATGYSQVSDFSLAEGLSESHILFQTDHTDEVACYRIPALVTAPNGDLLAAIDERVPSCGDLKWNRDINIVMRRSQDGGKTWSAVETLVDFPDGQSASDPSMIVNEHTQEIFLFYNFMDLDQAKDVYFFHLIRSTDNGLSWSAPLDITNQICPPAWKNDFKFITSGRGMQSRDGNMWHCLVNLDKGMHVFGSQDHGQSWLLLDTPIQPADESKIVELADGRWMINSRVPEAGMRYVHLSDDIGQSWQTRADTSLMDPACNASLIRYTTVANGADKNRLLFAHANSADSRSQLTVRISYDEGQSWSAGKVIYQGSAAYSSLTILSDGDIGLFFEKDAYQQNVFVRFSLDWLTGGQDKLKP